MKTFVILLFLFMNLFSLELTYNDTQLDLAVIKNKLLKKESLCDANLTEYENNINTLKDKISSYQNNTDLKYKKDVLELRKTMTEYQIYTSLLQLQESYKEKTKTKFLETLKTSDIEIQTIKSKLPDLEKNINNKQLKDEIILLKKTISF